MKNKEGIIIFILSISLIGVISAGVVKDKAEKNRLSQLRAGVQAATIKSPNTKTDNSFYDKVSEKQEISILVLGDAIGESSGVKEESKWYNSINKWINSEYGAKSNIKLFTSPKGNVFAGLSDFNFADNKKYDLVFICFGENDLKDMTLAQYSGVYEALVRNIKTNNNKCEVINIIESSIKSDKTFPEALKKISNYYNLQFVDTRDVFSKSQIPYNNLSSNGILPNEKGYELYSSAIEDLLKSNITNKRTVDYEAKTVLYPAALQFSKTTFVDKEIEKSGFEKQGTLISASIKGSSISYTFSGTMVAISFETGLDYGKLNITLDSKLLKKVDCYSEVSGKKILLMYNDVQPGQHKIKVQVSQEINPKSKGNKISLYGIIKN